MNINLVIPVHNQMCYLKECLESIAKTYTPSDMIHLFVHIINNGSTEKMINVGEIFNPKGIQFTVEEYGKNVGVTIPWNNGFKLAMDSNADVLCICNSDVVFGPEVIERCAIVALTQGVAFPHSIQGGPKPRDFDERAIAATKLDKIYQVTQGFAGWCFFLSRQCMERVGQFDEQFTLWYQDTDYNIRVRHAGYNPVDVVNVLLHHYESRTIVSMPNGFNCFNWRKQDEINFHNKWKDWGR